MRLMLCGLLSFVMLGCASRLVVKPQAEPSPTTISVVVVKEALLAGKIHVRAASLIRQDLLKNNIGVPVAEGASADMTLSVRITRANFSAATHYEWQLIDNQSGAIVAQGTKTPAMGHSENKIADIVLAELIQLDTRQYASGATKTRGPIKKFATDKFPGSETKNENAWAVIVGISQYRNELADAQYAREDAQAFSAFVQTTLGVPEKNVRLLTDEKASRSDIAAALFEWIPRNAVNEGGTVYVFFSGHGAPNVETGDAYLVPYDADPTYLKTGGIAVADVQQALSQLKGQTSFLFLDSCFSGSGERSVLAKGTRPVVPIKESQTFTGLITFTASKASQTTGVKADASHGLFTHYLLSGLSGEADKNNDRNVSLSEIVSFTSKSVEVEARQSNRDQQPSAQVPDGVDADSVLLVQGLSE